MSAHKPVHGHRATPDASGFNCRSCGREIVHIEDTVNLTPHWRHKPQGYNWGDRARYWQDRALQAEAALARLTS